MTALNRLALDGGTPALTTDDVGSWPQFTSGDDHRALRAANRTDRQRTVRSWGSAERLERCWRAVTGQVEVISCHTLASAVRLVTAGLGLDAGDEIIIPIGAEAEPALQAAGLRPVPVDLDPVTLHIDPRAVEVATTDRTAAVLAVDRFGTTADYDQLRTIAGRARLAMIEDASESIGATHQLQPVGGLGDASVCRLDVGLGRPSLGGGALCATDDRRAGLGARSAALVEGRMPRRIDRPAEYQPLDEVDAARAVARLLDLDRRTELRAAAGCRIRRELQPVAGIVLPEASRGASHVYRTLPLVVLADELGLPDWATAGLRDTVVDCLAAEGLDATVPVVGPTRPADRFPVYGHVLAAGLQIELADESTDHRVDSSIVDCVTKILVDHTDRVRELALQRAGGHR